VGVEEVAATVVVVVADESKLPVDQAKMKERNQP